MDIAQMRMILVLAECESMTTTAKKLHVTQPALTYQLKVIENELGFKVFNRTRVGTSLTAEGAFLHEKRTAQNGTVDGNQREEDAQGGI